MGDQDKRRGRPAPRVWLGLLLLPLVACGDLLPGSSQPQDAIGSVWGAAPVVGVVVRVSAWSADGQRQWVGRSEPTDAHGQFRIDGPLPPGPLVFVAAASKGGATLRAVVLTSGLAAAGGRVAISPLSEIEAALAESQRSRGGSPGEAVAHAKAKWQRHLGPIDISHAPSLLARSAAVSHATREASDDPSATLLAAFERLAQRRGRVAATAPEPWAALTRALVEDLQADGRLDGLGYNGAPLRVGALSLDGDTLRAAWAEAVLEEAESRASAPGAARASWLPLAESLVASSADLFCTVGHDLRRDLPQLQIDESLLWCDASGRAVLSGTIDRPLSALWLEHKGGRQRLRAVPKIVADGEQWFAGEVQGTRPEERFEATLWAVDRQGLSTSCPIAIECEGSRLAVDS